MTVNLSKKESSELMMEADPIKRKKSKAVGKRRVGGV
jgi:hypothetical protein